MKYKSSTRAKTIISNMENAQSHINYLEARKYHLESRHKFHVKQAQRHFKTAMTMLKHGRFKKADSPYLQKILHQQQSFLKSLKSVKTGRVIR